VALTVQRKLELAGDLAKVQPLLQRLRLVEQPKRRFGGHGTILVGTVIGVAAIALVAVAMGFRRRGRDDAVAGEGDLKAESAIEDAPPPDFALPIEDAVSTAE
jgi:hypothetical protein